MSDECRDDPWNVVDKVIQTAMYRHRTAPVKNKATNATRMTVKLSDFAECGFDEQMNAELFSNSANQALIRQCETELDIIFENRNASWDKKKITFNHTGPPPLLYVWFVVDAAKKTLMLILTHK